ncbi:Uncharacterised protein [uncultured archaeon]|nr:Uncharacterised protein [uncultured archaeon]
MKYATFFAPNLMMAISFIALGVFVVTGLRSKNERVSR